MTGFPDHQGGGPDGDGDRAGPVEPLLRQPPGYLDAPPGAFAQIRRRAARRRRARAAGGALAAAVVLTGSVYLVGAMTSPGSDRVVSPPASNSRTSAAPSTPTPTRGTAPTPSPSRPAARHSTGTRGGTTATTTAGPTPTRTGASATSGTSGTTPMCTTSQLTAALGGGDAGAGSLFRYLVLTNHSGTACHLTGYPGLSMLDAAGKQIGAPADRQPMSYAPVVLRPGGSASDTIHTVNQQGSCLPASVKLRIYPPGNTASLDFVGSVTDCDHLFTVTPLAAGSTGNPAS